MEEVPGSSPVAPTIFPRSPFGSLGADSPEIQGRPGFVLTQKAIQEDGSMMCEFCGQSVATIHYFESLNGKSRTLNLCDACATNKKGIGQLSLPMLTLDALIQGMDGQPGASQAPQARELGGVCVGCGKTYADFRHNPDSACPACHDTFLSLPELMRRARKIPRKWEPQEKIAQDALGGDDPAAGRKKLLEKAVELEQYEEAARLRDLIRLLEEEPSGRS